MDSVSILLINYALVLFINVVLSGFCIYYYRDKLYEYSLSLWIGTFINILLQGAFQKTSLSMVLSFSTYFGVFLIQLKILSLATHLSFPRKQYAAFVALCLVCSIMANWTHQSFTWIALPVAFGIAFVMFHSAMRALFSAGTLSNRGGTQIYSGLLIVHGLHLLDYPFLRNNPAYSALGFSFALVLLISFSIFLPSFILQNVSDRYLKKLELVNTELMKYQKEMGELMTLAQIGELSYSFVHDMASPTTLLMLYSGELSALHGNGVPSEDKMLPYSKGIEKATTRLINLQKMFKAMITIGNERNPCSVDLREVIQNCVDLFLPFLTRHQISLKTHFQSPETTIQTLPGVIDRILLNLIQNAINVLVDSKIRTIDLSIASREDGHMTIFIQDSGPGISKERMAHLWERFGHSETAKKSKDKNRLHRTGGSGFGLYKVKQLTSEIQAHIAVLESSSNGTTFKIDLPPKLSIVEKVAA